MIPIAATIMKEKIMKIALAIKASMIIILQAPIASNFVYDELAFGVLESVQS